MCSTNLRPLELSLSVAYPLCLKQFTMTLVSHSEGILFSFNIQLKRLIILSKLHYLKLTTFPLNTRCSRSFPFLRSLSLLQLRQISHSLYLFVVEIQLLELQRPNFPRQMFLSISKHNSSSSFLTRLSTATLQFSDFICFTILNTFLLSSLLMILPNLFSSAVFFTA